MYEVDVWLDGKALTEAQLRTLKANLQQSFKPLRDASAPFGQWPVTSHQTQAAPKKKPRSWCISFERWGIPLRVEHRDIPANQQTAPEPTLKGAPPTSFTLARAGERIPTQPAMTEPVKVSTDHLQLLD